VKYFVRLGDREYECRIEAENGQLHVTVDGRRYRADLTHVPRSDAYSLLLDGRSYEFTLQEGEEAIELSGGAGLFHARVEDARTHAARALTAPAGGKAGPQVVKAVMPGIVREVLVAPGADVAKGQALLILEAMKMQNEVRAERAGRVGALFVSPGDTVDKGAKLVELA
jgi:biotin carboxyl carrier protein